MKYGPIASNMAECVVTKLRRLTSKRILSIIEDGKNYSNTNNDQETEERANRVCNMELRYQNNIQTSESRLQYERLCDVCRRRWGAGAGGLNKSTT